MRDGAAGADRHHVLQVVPARAPEHRSRQGHQKIEHRVEEDGDGEHEPAPGQRRAAAGLAQQVQEGADDAVGGAAFHHALPHDSRHGDDNRDAPRRDPERLRDARDLLVGWPWRQHADDQRGGDQRDERVDPQRHDHSDDDHDPDGQDQQWMHRASSRKRPGLGAPGLALCAGLRFETTNAKTRTRSSCRSGCCEASYSAEKPCRNSRSSDPGSGCCRTHC